MLDESPLLAETHESGSLCIPLGRSKTHELHENCHLLRRVWQFKTGAGRPSRSQVTLECVTYSEVLQPPSGTETNEAVVGMPATISDIYSLF